MIKYSLLFLLLQGALFSQQIQVLDITNGQGVSNVLLFKQGKVISVTDSLGVIHDVCFERGDSLAVGHFKTYTFNNSCSKISQRIFYLEPTFVALSEVNYSINFLGEENEKESFQIDLLNEEKIEQNLSTNTADLLQSNGNVSVQKTQQGGGSPMIRGFEANRVLIMIDGVRMNNAIYRSNHLQNVMTIDPNVLERVEVVYGPSSSIYGSDALGGVMNFYTKNVPYTLNDSSFWQGDYNVSYSTVDDARNVNAGLSYFSKRYKFFTNVSSKRVNDLKMGINRFGSSEDLGLINYYPVQINGADSFAVNSDPSRLILGGYTQNDILHKQYYKWSDKLETILNVQFSSSSNINRLDRLYGFVDDIPKYSEWYYGPQERKLASLTINTSGNVNSQHILAYQDVSESRHSRLYQSDNLNVTKENVKVYSLSGKYILDSLKIGQVQLGYDAQLNVVSSLAYTESVIDNSRGVLETRYPSEGSLLSTGGLFAAWKKEIKKNQILNAGLRMNTQFMNVDFGEDNIMSFNESTFTLIEFAPTFNLSWKRILDKWNLGVLLASGFKAPNVDDFGKVFVKRGNVIVPNVNLRSEYSYNLDLSVKRKWKKASLEMTSFFSLIDQIIVERDFQISGQDSLFIEGEINRVRANVNLDKGWISGVSVQLKKEFSKEWSLFSNHNLQVGREMTSSISLSSLSLSHISPYFGRTGVLFENQKFKFWSSVSYNGRKKYKNLSEKEQSDVLNTGQDYNPFVLLDLGLSYHLWDSMKVQFNINNIADQHYIPFTSDVSGAGRSIIISLKGRF